ncbi:MAG: hypothetical protein RI930_254 [Pseudomonadota bacterium]|jgi:hypothetical protein
MENKLPVVGQRYRSIKYKTDIMLVYDAYHEHISYKYEIGDGNFSMEYVIPSAEFWDYFEELPPTTKETDTCSSEVKEALEKLKMAINSVEARAMTGESGIVEKVLSRAQNLINALESKENK